MNEPKRLIDGVGPSRALVASMHDDGLSVDAHARLRASLGLSLATAASAATAAGQAAVATKAGAAAEIASGALGAKAGASGTGATLGAKTLFAGASLAKWATVLVLGAAGVGAAGVASHRRAAPSRAVSTSAHALPALAPSTAVRAPSSTAPDGPRAEPSAIPVVVVEALPAIARPEPPRSPASPGRRSEPTRGVSAPAVDLGGELRTLEGARGRLRAGDPSGALALLAAYREASPRGALGVEADVLEIEALAVSGRPADAASRAEQFLAQHPNAPLSDRVRRMLR